MNNLWGSNAVYEGSSLGFETQPKCMFVRAGARCQ